MCFMSYLDSCEGMLRFLSACRDGLCIEPFTPFVMVIRKLIFRPFVVRGWMSGLYLSKKFLCCSKG